MEALAIAMLALPALASGAPATFDSLSASGRSISAQWTVPLGMRNFAVEAATGPALQDSGPNQGAFRPEVRVAYVSTLANTTNRATLGPLPGGLYHVHVGVFDSATCSNPWGIDCAIEFSEIRTVVVPGIAPSITAARAVQRRIDLSWTVPSSPSRELVEIATAPDVYGRADAALAGQFLAGNLVESRWLDPVARSYRSEKLPGGTYYVHVGALDAFECANHSLLCSPDFNPPLPVVVPRDPPVLTSVALEGKLKAGWTLPSDMFADFIEVANAPHVYTQGEREGEFLDQHRVFADVLGDRQQAYESGQALALGPGTYYAHVAAYVPSSCFPDPQVCDIYEFSDPLAFTVAGPPAPVAPAAQAGPPKAAVGPLLSSLAAAKRQSVRRLHVRGVLRDHGTLTASATVSVPGAARRLHFRTASASAKPGVPVRLKLRLAKKALRTVRKALRRHRLNARIMVVARDKAGNTSRQKRTVRLTR